MKATQLTKITFSTMENDYANAIGRTLICVFADDKDGLTAHGKLAQWFERNPPTHLYLAWDGEVYPKWEIKEIEIFQPNLKKLLEFLAVPRGGSVRFRLRWSFFTPGLGTLLAYAYIMPTFSTRIYWLSYAIYCLL